VTLRVTPVTILELVVHRGLCHSKVEPLSNLFADKISDPDSSPRVCNLKNQWIFWLGKITYLIDLTGLN